MPTATAKRASRKSSPAAGKQQQQQRSRSSSKSRSKSASPTAKPRQRSTSKSRTTAAQEKKKTTQQQQKPRSRSSSRSRKPVSPASTTSTPQAVKKTAPRPPTPTVAKQRRSSGGVKAVNHGTSGGSSSSRSAAAAAAGTASTVTATRSSTSTATASTSTRIEGPGREFGGSFGTAVMTIGLPIALIWLSLFTDGKVSFSRSNRYLFGCSGTVGFDDLFSTRAALIYGGFLLFQLVLYCLPIGGRWVHHEGGLYHCNGLFALLVSMIGLVFANWWGIKVGPIICSELTRLVVCSCLFSALLSVGLYARSRRVPISALTVEAASSATNSAGRCCNCVYEFFMGRELHPRLFGGRIDLKFFLEMRPGLIGWMLLDMAYMYQAKAIVGGNVGYPFATLTFMHLMYVGDALLFEKSILTTTDIKREGLGYMLAFGNLAWVPFFYSLSARQLIKVANQPTMPLYCVLGIFVINFFGYLLFRVSNYMKDEFRRDPHLPKFAGVRTVPTGIRGRHLLVAGFWALCRHPNFVGDLIMAVCWSLAAGCHAPLAWLYPVYLFALLIHRARRDEIHCAAKYGHAWKRYCEMVPNRFLPKIFA